MKLKLTQPGLVGAHHYNAGDVVEVEDEKRAKRLIGQGFAEQAKDGAKVTEPGAKAKKPTAAEKKAQEEAAKKKAEEEAEAKKKADEEKAKADVGK